MNPLELLKGYKLVEEDEVPELGARNTFRTSAYDAVLDEFLESKDSLIVRVEIEWPDGTTNGMVEAVVCGLRNRVKKRRLPLVLQVRAGDIYLSK